MKNTCHKCGKPSHGKTCRDCFLSRKRVPKPEMRKRKNARQQRYAWSGKCTDCPNPCSPGAKRCKTCRAVYAKGKKIDFGKKVNQIAGQETKPIAVPVKPRLTFSEWLLTREKALHRLFERMDESLKQRVMVGINRNIKAQRLNAKKNDEVCRIDLDPIREILHDAAYHNKFFFEDD